MNGTPGKLVLVDHDGPVPLMLRELASGSMRVEAATHAALLEHVRRDDADAVVIQLDRETPEPAEILRALRGEDKTVALFACSELFSTAEAVLAYEMGADDYFSHEIERAVLEAKLRRALRRRTEIRGHSQTRAIESHIGELKPSYEIDLFDMTRIEERLCRALNNARGKTVSFTELLESVWGRTPPPPYLLYEHVSSLRAKLFAQGFTIRNLRGQGYRLEPLSESATRPRRRSG